MRTGEGNDVGTSPWQHQPSVQAEISSPLDPRMQACLMTTVFNNGQDLQEACRHLCTRTIKPECTGMEQYDVRGPRVGVFHEPPYECVTPGVLNASISSIVESVLRHFARAFRLRILEW